MKSSVLPVGVCSVVFALALSGCAPKPEAHTTQAPAKTVRAQTMTVGTKLSGDTFEASGTVRPYLDATLGSKVLGRVTAVTVREGDVVKAGQVLVTIDSRELQAAVAVAESGHSAAVVGVGSAKTAATMEEKTSAARIQQAEAAQREAEAGLAAAQARRDLVVAGPRSQEVSQAHIAVIQAQSSLKLAQKDLDRMTVLAREGAISQRDLEVVQNHFDLAKAQYDAAVEGESIAREGSRAQEIRAANEAVGAAEAAVRQARSGVASAKAAAMQVDVRKRDIEAADAQVRQSAAAAQAARVTLSYGQVVAPFDGRVVKRFVDPGAMASPGSPLVQIEGGGLQLWAVVPETVLPSLQIGGTAQVTVEATKVQAEASIAEIVPQGDAMSHSFVVKLALAPDSPAKSGMFGHAVFTLGDSPKILVPVGTTWNREGLDYVFTVNPEGVARLRIVTLGRKQGGVVEVLSGLSPGDKVVTSDPKQVADGDKVEEARS